MMQRYALECFDRLFCLELHRAWHNTGYEETCFAIETRARQSCGRSQRCPTRQPYLTPTEPISVFFFLGGQGSESLGVSKVSKESERIHQDGSKASGCVSQAVASSESKLAAQRNSLAISTKSVRRCESLLVCSHG